MKKATVFIILLFVFAVSTGNIFAESVDLSTPSQYAGGKAVDANSLVGFIINLFVVIGIILSLIFLLYGGVRWVVSGGDKAKVDSARSTIVAAIVGLIIVILAWIIINTVLQLLTGTGLQNFKLPSLPGGVTSASPTPKIPPNTP